MGHSFRFPHTDHHDGVGDDRTARVGRCTTFRIRRVAERARRLTYAAGHKADVLTKVRRLRPGLQGCAAAPRGPVHLAD